MSLAFVFAGCAGCGPSRLLAPPESLPARLGGRALWHTPSAYIYAGDKAVAGETQRWIDELASHLRRTYDAPLGKGLVVVVDEGEPPVVTTLEEGMRLQAATAARCRTPPGAVVDAEARRTELARAGFSESLYCRTSIVALDEASLRAAGISSAPDDVAWTLCCPSERLMSAAVWEFAPAALERNMGKIAAATTALAWPLAFAEAAKAFRLNRDVLVFQMWAAGRDDWSDDRRQAQAAQYMRERALRLSPLLAMAMKSRDAARDGAATQPAAQSQPAAAP